MAVNGTGTETGTTGRSSGPGGFDSAKLLMQTTIDRFAEGELDRHSVMAEADAVAAACKVRASDLRGWAKAQMDALTAIGADLWCAFVAGYALRDRP